MREVKQLGDTSKAKKSVKTKDRSSKEVRTVKIQYPWLYASIVLFLTVPLFMFFMGYLKLAVGISLRRPVLQASIPYMQALSEEPCSVRGL